GRVSPVVTALSALGGIGMLLVFVVNWLPFSPFPPLEAPFSWFAYIILAWIFVLIGYFLIRRHGMPDKGRGATAGAVG
ncbi:MAG: hypothetical protein JOY78_04705, partial [Pseudonocardia sp.]|nr:hypothetical protein [Pseudonocardia sp.]